MDIRDLIYKEIQSRHMFFVNKEDFFKKMDNFLSKYNFITMMQSKFNEIDDKFIRVIDKMSLEQIIVFKFFVATQRTKGEVLPKIFFDNLDYILKFIVIKYIFSVYGDLKSVCQYLQIPEEQVVKMFFPDGNDNYNAREEETP